MDDMLSEEERHEVERRRAFVDSLIAIIDRLAPVPPHQERPDG